MLIVLPVSHVDEHQMIKLLEHLADPADSSHQHPAMLVCSRRVADVDRLASLAEKAFASVGRVVLETEPAQGWPLAANRMFQYAVVALRRRNNKLPWYWLEADNVPTRRSWLTELSTEYNQARKPFMGPKEATRLNDSRGRFVKHEGNHINGSAIYPADFTRWSILWEYATQEPWDLYCRWEIFPKAHCSELMASRWGSSEFKKSADGTLAFTSKSPHSNQASVDPRKAAVIHGCKDDSLFKLLWEKEEPVVLTRKVVEPEPTPLREVVRVLPPEPKKKVLVLEED